MVVLSVHHALLTYTHRPPPLVFPESSTDRSALWMLRPVSSMALSGISLLSQVSVKIITLLFLIQSLLMIHSSSASILFTREHTLARKMEGSDSRFGVSLSLARSPPRFPLLCLRSQWGRVALAAGLTLERAAGVRAISTGSLRSVVEVSVCRLPMSKMNCRV